MHEGLVDCCEIAHRVRPDVRLPGQIKTHPDTMPYAALQHERVPLTVEEVDALGRADPGRLVEGDGGDGGGDGGGE